MADAEDSEYRYDAATAEELAADEGYNTCNSGVGYDEGAAYAADGHPTQLYGGGGAEIEAQGYDEWIGYEYDAATGEYVYTGNGVEDSYFALDETDPTAPASPFGDEAYWQQYGAEEETPASEAAEALLDEVVDDGVNECDAPTPVTDDGGSNPAAQSPSERTEIPPMAAVSDTTPSSAVAGSQPPKNKKKKAKTKEERMKMRQELLEKEEAEKLEREPVDGADNAAVPSPASMVVKQSSKRSELRPSTFLERERAKVRLRLRKARAIGRKRMPLQVRILTETRKHLSPMESYFGGSVEPALSDIFWAAMKGDLGRVRFLVEVESVSASDAALDPWHMEQTPLHWAAKGGSAAVVQYLLQAGVNPRSIDEDYDAALSPLDWAAIRGHTTLVKAIERFEDCKWLPKFVDDLVRGIIRYKIKLYKDLPKAAKSPTRGINFRRPGAALTPAAEPTSQAENQTMKATTEPEDADHKPDSNPLNPNITHKS